MTARRLAFQILHRVEHEGAYASVLLDHHQDRLDDPRDAALARELVLGVLRHRALLDHVIAGAAGREPERIDAPVLLALRVGAYEILFLDRVPAFATVDSSVEVVRQSGYRRAAGFTNAVLRAIARRGAALLPPEPAPGDVKALALRHSHPVWWVERLLGRLGWEPASRLLAAHNRPAPPVLCPHPRRVDAGELARRLAGEGVDTEPCGFLPDALRVLRGAPQRTRAHAAGEFWIQDEASQLVGRLAIGAPTAARRVGRAIELCAAPGGKSLQLATTLPDDGWLVACDVRPARLAQLRRRLQLAELDNVSLLAADMSVAPAPLRARFDTVLVDAPCSGSGTLRRHPELRWRLAPEDPARLARLQLALLESGADLLAPGGTLVYAVCSLEPEEGPDVVEAFRRRRPGFVTIDARERLPTAAAALVAADRALHSSPADGLDGFFAVALRVG